LLLHWAGHGLYGHDAQPFCLVIAMIISLPTILLIVLILLLLGALPTWPHSRNWGYYPSGGIGLVVVILIIVLLIRGGI
jgi:Protein of unknown function (DUF3309)